MGSRKKKTFGPVERARLQARHAAGAPPAGRVIPAKKHKGPKHKKRMIEEELAGLE